MISVYIHIPFCDTICSYCDFCKVLYNQAWVDEYLEQLSLEINKYYKNEIVKTLYIGGGTPSSLSVDQLDKLFDIVSIFNKSEEIEITFECNIENITKEKLDTLKINKVNRLSIGVQTFNEKFLSFLNRNHAKNEIKEKINLAKEMGFKNISIDLMYAFKDQTLEDLKEDMNHFIDLDINHISTYSLIIEPNTKLYLNNIKNIDEDLDDDMYQAIVNTLTNNKFVKYETSNFAKEGFESKHNQVYWNNEEYYGFGAGASGYIDSVRYENTRSVIKYIKGTDFRNEIELDQTEKMRYEMILGLRKTKGVSKELFKIKYGIDLLDYYDLNQLIREGKLIDEDGYIKIDEKYHYVANEILIKFV